MAINYFDEKEGFKYSGKLKTKKWIAQLVNLHQKQVGELSIIFCSDAYLLDMNKQYLGHDYFTDVITFDYSEFPTVAGDIFISVDTVANNAKEYGATFENELQRVIAHGVLHLCGFDDGTDAQKMVMRSQEDIALAMFYAPKG